ncbi:hypothetical protein ACIBHX_02105 [Nonomuraea sp. NPDC050536]|uniref:hypothetical protein n=1 Tax=Nonomuraea sp. NPDC050536 TaxID=3364366 RepID=UPI0037CA29E6
MADRFPANALAELRQLRNDVEELKALLRQQPALTTASAGWQMPNRSAPPTPASGGHLFANSKEPFWKDSDGTVYSLKPFDKASNVSSMTATSGTANDAVVDVGISYSQNTINDNFRDVVAKLNAILLALKNAGHMFGP